MNTKELTKSLIEEAFKADISVQYKNVKVVLSGEKKELGYVSMVYLTRDDKEGEIVLIVRKTDDK